MALTRRFFGEHHDRLARLYNNLSALYQHGALLDRSAEFLAKAEETSRVDGVLPSARKDYVIAMQHMNRGVVALRIGQFLRFRRYLNIALDGLTAQHHKIQMDARMSNQF